MRYTFILLITFIFVGCGPFNTIDSFESDGIYDNNNMKVSQNNNGTYYKNYFDQKYQEYGFDNQINDSVLTDISNYSSNHVDEYLHIDFDYIITVCDHAKESCPLFDVKDAIKIHKDFIDPSKSDHKSKLFLENFRIVRDDIKKYFKDFINEVT